MTKGPRQSTRAGVSLLHPQLASGSAQAITNAIPEPALYAGRAQTVLLAPACANIRDSESLTQITRLAVDELVVRYSA